MLSYGETLAFGPIHWNAREPAIVLHRGSSKRLIPENGSARGGKQSRTSGLGFTQEVVVRILWVKQARAGVKDMLLIDGRPRPLSDISSNSQASL